MMKSYKDTARGKNHRGAVLDRKGGYAVIDCSTCRFKHVAPLPADKTLAALYGAQFYERKPRYFKENKEDSAWWDLAYGDRYDTMEAALPKRRRRILDIGSGPGFFLLHGKKRGWDTVGVEPSGTAAAYSRKLGLDIVEGFFDKKLAGTLGTFDAVHMSEVLEHLPDPAGALALARSLLAPGGILCVSSPNDYNPIQQTLRSVEKYKPWWVTPPLHLNYFSVQSLAALMKRAGFDVFLQEASFPIDLFLLMGDNYVHDDALGRACHAKRKRLELAFAAAGRNGLRRELYRACAGLGLGRDCLVFGKRR